MAVVAVAETESRHILRTRWRSDAASGFFLRLDFCYLNIPKTPHPLNHQNIRGHCCVPSMR
ncbi:hypothetical protein, partial [Paenibacillus helianthi]|uniref:hypothetical protein n=1 Tax=Paenibacillus helianthi TaxID=1349432 RepID=UPI001ABF93E4